MDQDAARAVHYAKLIFHINHIVSRASSVRMETENLETHQDCGGSHMLSFTLPKAYTNGGVLLFSDIKITLEPGMLPCLTGPNGSGKSTLLHLIKEQAEQTGLECLFLNQKTPHPGEVSWMGKNLNHPGSPGEIRAKELFSLLDQAGEADLILLDEPGNHLDQNAHEKFLFKLGRIDLPMLIVSHDRRLLSFADRIYHLDEGILEQYTGGFEDYKKNRHVQLNAKQQRLEHTLKQKKSAERKLQSSLERQSHRQSQAIRSNVGQKNPLSLIHARQNRADRTRARLEKTHQRLVKNAKNAEQQHREERLSEGRAFKLYWKQTDDRNKKRSKGPILSLRDVWPLFPGPTRNEISSKMDRETGVSFQLFSGGRLAILGKNGSGKSSLLNIIADEHKSFRGELQRGNIRIYYHRQVFDTPADERVCDFHFGFLDHVSEGELRTALAAAGFTGDDVFRSVHSLSGGEWCRLNLSRAAISQADLLLLDEPTNDLDEISRNELREVLETTGCAFILVTHDDEFLEELKIDSRIEL